jgi:nitrous oxidase accessory protein NosD
VLPVSRFLPRRWTLARLASVAAIAGLAASLLGAGVAGAATSPALYVSASTGSDSNPCSMAAPCATIDHAIGMAAPGSTIVAEAGTYDEQVIVTKRLTLVGRGAVIDAAGLAAPIPPLSMVGGPTSPGIVGYGVLIMGPGASGSVFRGFTVENALGEGILAAATSRVSILDNTVEYNDAGFGGTATFECEAQGNIPGDCGEGLHLLSVTWARVIGNTVQDNVGGILVTDEMGPAAHNLIANNLSRDNALDCGITLPSHNPDAMTSPSLGGVYDNTVIHNVSEGNGGAGVGMFAPFPGTASYDNRVIGNTLMNNGEAGVGIHAHAPSQNVSGNVIVNNVISGNGIDPDSGSPYAHNGIVVFGAFVPVRVTVAANRISNEDVGIYRSGPSVTVLGIRSNKFASTVGVDWQ